jgi:hypothetical protein
MGGLNESIGRPSKVTVATGIKTNNTGKQDGSWGKSVTCSGQRSFFIRQHGFLIEPGIGENQK